MATLRATALYVFAICLPFVALGTIAIDRGIRIGWLADFRIGNVEIPKLMGMHASNIDVAILCGVGIVATVVAYLIRYLTYRPILARARARGLTDLNGDGRTDVYTDRFLDDL
jgi:hypothetical protein